MGTTFRIGIIGAGHIAEKIAGTIGRMPGFECSAVASRSLEKARDFADRFGIKHAYGSYEELVDTDTADMLYIATPHSHHFDITRKAILAGKPCLVEKAFMPNARLTEEILNLSKERGVFVAEAIWTRCLPSRSIVDGIISSGEIGKVRMISATLSYLIDGVERIIKPDLCGGALLDIGIYPLNFAMMVHDAPIKSVVSSCVKSDSGVDFQESISIIFEDGVMANLQTSACCNMPNQAVVSGTEGYLVADNVNNPKIIRVYKGRRELVREVAVPEQISGYEYELAACRDAIRAGLVEPSYMPHSETLRMMEIMDGLRREWGVVYPMDVV